MRDDDSDSTLSTFTASNGENIAVQEWLLDPDDRPRGTVLIVHGLGEYAGRYDHVARLLNRWSFNVRAYDQYGHGESEGARGGLPKDTRLLDDLADIVESTRNRMEGEQPLVLLGHSMGGLVAAIAVALGRVRVDGLVLSSPAFDAGFTGFQKFMLATVPRVLPGMTLGNGIDPQYISRNPAVVAAYKADPLVHDRISARLARFIAQAGPAVIQRAPAWSVPTLLMYAGADRLVKPGGSFEFAARAPRDVVTTREFEHAFHEIFNEPDSAKVFGALRDWLEERFPA